VDHQEADFAGPINGGTVDVQGYRLNAHKIPSNWGKVFWMKG